MNYNEAYQYGDETLQASGIEDAAQEALLLLEHICHTKRSDLYAHPDKELRAEESDAYQAVLAQRALHLPYAQITGNCAFMGLNFFVNEHVLIPRPDTECLVEECMPQLHDGMTFMDLCTGSACIALSLLHYSNHTRCVATDLSEEALSVATRNAQELELTDRIEFIKTDLFPERQLVPEKGLDLIVSNPPYIESDVIATLMPEVREHEPRMALDGGADGLDFYRRIVEKAPNYLARGGMLLVEIGYDQGESVPALFTQAGFKNVKMIRDLAGNARVVSGVYF